MHNSFIFSLVPLLLPCGFMSPKIIWSWYSILCTVCTAPQRKIKALARFPLLRTGLKKYDLGGIRKLTSLAVLFIPVQWLMVLSSSWFYGSTREEKARRLLCFRKCVWLSTIITVSQAMPHTPGGPLDRDSEGSSLEPFMRRCRAGRGGKISKTSRRFC